jgi:hypothetical protein
MNRLLLVISCQLRLRLSSASRGRSFHEAAAGGQPGSTAAQVKMNIEQGRREHVVQQVGRSVALQHDAAAGGQLGSTAVAQVQATQHRQT